MDSTEELGEIKEEDEIPERSGGEEERDLNLSDRTRDPMLTPQEKQDCETAKDHVQKRSGEKRRHPRSGKH